MSVQITHRRMSFGGYANEHIEAVKWRSDADGSVDASTREEMVKWIDGGGYAYVVGPYSKVQVGVVRATPPYLRTYADGTPTDNLLALPLF